MQTSFQIGQRWMSETEPELGLGEVRVFTARTVTLVFAASGETREYAVESAPIRRVRFKPGDQVRRGDGPPVAVDEVSERDGLLFYQAGGRVFPESELSGQVSWNTPQERLRVGQVDPASAFDLRAAALRHQHHRRKSAVRGFVGGRIELIAHQLYIAPEVARRLSPRVLLADEVGLGKTIEACLILSRLVQTRRAERVLVLVPEPLVHQWFVELLRKFNLWFHIFDEERCDAIETANPESNPFLDDQLVLAGIQFLAQNPRRGAQCAAAGWDLLVVDEAHHLGWTPQAASPEYQLVESLAAQTPALLLLTATPEQLGIESHFARLRLLDPDRYFDLATFLKEAEHYREVAAMANSLLQGQPLTAEEMTVLRRILGPEEPDLAHPDSSAARRALLDDLIDRHGTGRIMFRNTRATMSGWPRRVAQLWPQPVPAAGGDLLESVAREFAADNGHVLGAAFEPKFTADPRILWLAGLLRELRGEKVLLICRSPAKVKAIDTALRQRIQVPVGLFHEELPLVQRDRNAAWFGEEDGAQLLLASEIGSEGRNFQFAHHLVLFDLPLNPELMEQRIGRLDRIGQKAEIHIHVPYVERSAQEVLARWYHDGLHAFEKNLRGAHQLLERLGPAVVDLAQDFHETQDAERLRALIRDAQAAVAEVAAQLEQGRDRLLELNSFRPEVAEPMIQFIREADQDRTLENFMLEVFDHYGIALEEIAARTYHLGSAGVFADLFPGLPSEGLTVTLDRQHALAREDVQFLTWDHPLVTGALDLILGSGTGSASVAHWPGAPAPGFYLEAVYLLEALAPPELHVDRFLPPTPIHVAVDHQAEERRSLPSPDLLRAPLRPGAGRLLESREVQDELIPHLLAASESLARRQAPDLIAQARSQIDTQLGHEISRLQQLQAVNPNVSPQEIASLVEQQQALHLCLERARLRLDALRVVVCGP